MPFISSNHQLSAVDYYRVVAVFYVFLSDCHFFAVPL